MSSFHAIKTVLETPGHSERDNVLKSRFAFSLRKPIPRIPLLRTRTDFTGRFFIATDDSICIAVGNMKSRGYPLHYFESDDNLKSLKMLDKEKKPTGNEIARQIVSRFHENAWHDIKKELTNGTCCHEFSITKPRFLQVRSTFEKHYRHHAYSVNREMQLLEEAFDHCREYSWHHSAWDKRGRDISIEVKPEPDGKTVKAWYSSEFSGCGNGSYYLLISPTTAVFYEDD